MEWPCQHHSHFFLSFRFPHPALTEIKIVSLEDLSYRFRECLREYLTRRRVLAVCGTVMPCLLANVRGNFAAHLARVMRDKEKWHPSNFIRGKVYGISPVSRNRIYLRKNVTGARMIYKPGSYCPGETHTLLGVVKIDFFLRGR